MPSAWAKKFRYSESPPKSRSGPQGSAPASGVHNSATAGSSSETTEAVAMSAGTGPTRIGTASPTGSSRSV